MGFRISWIAFKDVGKTYALSKLNAIDTGEVDEANESPFSGAEIPGAWFVVFCNDFGFVSEARLAELSAQCKLVACQVQETVMVSAAYGYEHGRLVWGLLHDSDQSIYDLSVLGSPPETFEAIRTRLRQEQDDNGGETAEVDYVFDIPIETAEPLCGYRHDRWGEPRFTRLEMR